MSSQLLRFVRPLSTVEKFLVPFILEHLLLDYTRVRLSSPRGGYTKEPLRATERPSVPSGPITLKVVGSSLWDVCRGTLN